MRFLPHGTSLCEYTRFPQHNSSSDRATEKALRTIPLPRAAADPRVSPIFPSPAPVQSKEAKIALQNGPLPPGAGRRPLAAPATERSGSERTAGTPGLDGLGAPTPGHRDCLPAHVGSGQPPPAPPPAPRSSPPRPRRLRAAAQSRSRRRPARAAAASGESAGVPAPQPSAPPPFASAASSAPAPAARRCCRSSRCSTLLPLLRAAPRPPPPPPPPRARG